MPNVVPCMLVRRMSSYRPPQPILLVALLLTVCQHAGASKFTVGRARAVGRHLHPGLARTRATIAPPSWQGGFLTASGLRHALPTALWVPLYPYELGAYVTTLTLGTGAEAQSVTGLIDTGSGIVHFPCRGCSGNGCDQAIYPDLEFYDSAASSSYVAANCSDYLAPFLVFGTTGGAVNAMNCTWFADQDNDSAQIAGELAYAGGNSASFRFFHDIAAVGDVTAPPSLPPFEPLVACDFAATASSFGAGFSGIFGMNFQPGSLFSQVISSYSFENEMTFCLGDGHVGVNDTRNVVSMHSGFMAFGAVKPLKPPLASTTWRTPLVFTAGSGWYSATSYINVGVVGLHVDDVAVMAPVSSSSTSPSSLGGRPLYNFFLDTGTAVVSYPPALLAPLRRLLAAALRRSPLVASVVDQVETDARLVVTYKNTSRLPTNAEKDALLPTIYFQFVGTGKVPFRPSSYLIYAGPPLITDFVPPATEFIFMANAAISIGETLTGVLGNAWLNRMLVQVQQDVINGGGSVSLTLVEQCSSVTLVAA